MSIEFHPIQAEFAAEVIGIDTSSPLPAGMAEDIQSAADRYAVLIFRDQPLTDAQQQAFSLNFGPIEDSRGGNVAKPEDRRLSQAMNDVSNIGRDNKPLARTDRQRLFNIGNRLWHSDSSFRAIPAKYSILSGRQVPSGPGGNTEFADMRAAYEALDEVTRTEIAELICEHSLLHSRGALGFDVTEEERKTFQPVRQKLLRTHQTSGRKSLYLSAHAGAILGWPAPEAQMLLRDLTEHATQPRFVYSHVWRQHDLVMWDNRCTMHRARRYDESEIRDMRRTTVAGDEMTVPQIT